MSMIIEAQENEISSNNELSLAEKSQRVDKVVELLLAKERKGWGKRGEKKAEFKKLADKFELSVKTIHNNYYKKVVPIINEEHEKAEDKASRKAKLSVVKKSAKKNAEDAVSEVIQEQQEMQELKVEATIESTENASKIVNEVKEKRNVDDSINQFLETTGKEIKKNNVKFEKDVYGRPMKPPYKHNDILEVRVDHIRDFGVFCYTCDEYEYKGLIHISEIKDIFVSDANDYFSVGDIIKVKVMMATANRLTFSTRDMKLQPKSEKEDIDVSNVTLPKSPPLNTIGEKFGKELQSKFSSMEIEQHQDSVQKEVEEILKEDEAVFENAEIEQLITNDLQEEAEQEQKQNALTSTRVNERDFEDVQSFLNNKIGALSPNAKLMLMEILEKKGMFISSIAINKVAENFDVDYGLIFMKMVSKELEKDECL